MFSFPTFKQLFPNNHYLGAKHFKFVLRCYRAKKAITAFEQFINQNSLRQQLLKKAPHYSDGIIHSYLNKQFSTPQQRLVALQHDIEQAEQCFGDTIFKTLINQSSYRLSTLNDQLHIQINLNDLCSNEGLWAISLRDKENHRLYTATFAFLNQNKMLITSIQGPSGEQAKEQVRTLTKTFYGLRPQQLMLIVLQIIAIQFHQQALLGISQQNHVKNRFRFRKRYLLDYDEFWLNAKATLENDGYWHVPLTQERKAEAEIESKKRSMYRKRYTLLDNMMNDIQKQLEKH